VAERARALERVAALEREFAGLAEAARSAGTDDEHDPEGATLAFERQHAAALLEAAREQVTAFDAALERLAARTGWPPARPRRLASAAPPEGDAAKRCAAGGRRR